MDFISSVFDIILSIVFPLMFLFITKTLYEDTIVIDRVTAILLGFIIFLVGPLSILGEIGVFGKEKWPAVDNVLTWIYFGVMMLCYLRGGKNGLWQRIRAVIEAFFPIVMLLLVGDFMIRIISPEWSIPYIKSEEMTLPGTAITLLITGIYLFYSYYFLYRKGVYLRLNVWERTIWIVFSIYIAIFFVDISDYIVNGTFMDIAGEIRGYLGITSVSVFVLFPVFLVKHKLSEYYKKGQEFQQEWIAMEMQHFHQYKEAQEDTRRFRHDIIHNLSCLQMLMQEKKYDDAARYVCDMIGKVEELSPKVVTGVEMLDCIVASKWENMKSVGIGFFVDGVLDHGLNWKLIDLCSVFANAMDNAIEACTKIPNGQKREIKLSLKRTKNFYYVELRNSMVEKNTGLRSIPLEKRYTTKENKELHGYGMENMRRTVEQYDGTMEVELLPEEFCLKFMLPVNS